MTGTPVSSGLSDIFGVLSFLQSDPFGDNYWWQRVIQRPIDQGDPAGLSHLIILTTVLWVLDLVRRFRAV